MSKERAKELLGAGLSNVVVASALGLSESMISQWLSEDSFREEVQKLRLTNLTEAAGRDRKWNSLEDRLLERLEELLPTLVNPAVVLHALKLVNGAVRRSSPQELGAQAQSTHLHLHLPAVIAAKFTINQNSQVIEVDGRSVATMPAAGVVAAMNKLAEVEGLPVSKSAEEAATDADLIRARERLVNLQKLEHLPIHQVI
jgi:transcriptional regulator with XRE-family HTH domain